MNKISKLFFNNLARSAAIAALMFSPFTQHQAMNKALNFGIKASRGIHNLIPTNSIKLLPSNTPKLLPSNTPKLLTGNLNAMKSFNNINPKSFGKAALAGLAGLGLATALVKNKEELADATVKTVDVINNVKDKREIIEDAKKRQESRIDQKLNRIMTALQEDKTGEWDDALDRIDDLKREEKYLFKEFVKKIGADQEYLIEGNRRINEKFDNIRQKIDSGDFSKINSQLYQDIYKENYKGIGENLTNILLNTGNISRMILRNIKNQIFPVNEEKRAANKRVRAELKKNLSELSDNLREWIYFLKLVNKGTITMDEAKKVINKEKLYDAVCKGLAESEKRKLTRYLNDIVTACEVGQISDADAMNAIDEKVNEYQTIYEYANMNLAKFNGTTLNSYETLEEEAMKELDESFYKKVGFNRDLSKASNYQAPKDTDLAKIQALSEIKDSSEF